MKRRALAIATAALLVIAPPAAACSVQPGTRAASSFEMTRNADVILIGIVEDAPRVGTGDYDQPQMIVRPIEILKGGPLPERIRVRGWLAQGRFVIRSDPNELSEAHPEAGMGSCNRISFSRNSRILFFLDRREAGFVDADGLYSRWAEDVPRRNSRWVTTVRNLVEVASLPESEWRAALAQRRDSLAARTGDRAARAIAEELDRQLALLDEPAWIRAGDYEYPPSEPAAPQRQ